MVSMDGWECILGCLERIFEWLSYLCSNQGYKTDQNDLKITKSHFTSSALLALTSKKLFL